MQFYLDSGGPLIKEVGYVPLTDAEQNLVRQRFTKKTTGTMFDASAPMDPKVSLEQRLKRRQMNNRQRRVVEFVIERTLFLCAAVSVLVTGGIIAVLLFETIAFLREVSIVEFLTGTEWTPLFSEKHFGVLPLVAGTALVSAIAMVVALPAGLLAAIYLSEYAPPRLRRVVKPLLEVLAGVPTVVYGYFALLFVTPLLQQFIPTLSGFNALGPGIVMGIMILPAGLLAL